MAMHETNAHVATDAEQSSSAPNTHLGEPRQRVFLPQRFRERLCGLLWSVAWHALFRWSPRTVNWWRILLLRCFGAKIGRGVFIAPSVRVHFPWNLTVGDGTFIEHHAIINAMGRIAIGSATRISQYAHLCAGTHDHRRPDMRIMRHPITIGTEVWIAADAFVGPGVSIGNGALLAARSSAFRDLPASQVCIGEPAKPVKPRDAQPPRPMPPREK